MKPEELLEHCQAVRSELFAAVVAGLDNTHHKNSRPVPAFSAPSKMSVAALSYTLHISQRTARSGYALLTMTISTISLQTRLCGGSVEKVRHWL